MTAIFISHRSTDKDEAASLKAWLEDQGHQQLFLDFDPMDGIPAGVDWEQRLYQELRRCQALLIVLTPAWLDSKWCSNELAIAREKGKAVFVVRAKPCPKGPLIPAIQEVDLTVDRDHALSKLAKGLKENGLDPADAFGWQPNRPIYPGLTAFDIDDAAIFFGRSEESWQVVETLRRMRLQAVGAPRLLLITGASGSGKSSLMRAGVLARLRKDPANWIVARPFRRGGDAIAALAEALAWAFPPERRPSDIVSITTRLSAVEGARELIGLARDLRLALDRPDATLVLAVDQAEELLVSEQAADAARLLDLLREALCRVGSEIIVLATIRSDRLGAWQQHGSIKATAEHGELPFEMAPLGPMPMARIGEIVRGPAAYEGLRIDDDLVDAIRAETATPDALPLLAYTLQYLHRNFAGDGRLTLAEYRSFGGLEGSVRRQADTAIPIERMDEDERRALREAFVPGLVRATADGGFSRHRAKLASLPARAEPHLRRLIDDARLLLTDRDAAGEVTVEVAHESLLRVWPTLERWIAEDSADLRRLEALQRAAADWGLGGRGYDFLVHRDQRLTDAETLVAEPRFAVGLRQADRDYLAACRTRQNEREAQDREARERELRSARELAARRRQQVRGAIVAVVLLLVVAAAAAWQWRDAVTARNEATQLAASEAMQREAAQASARLAEERLAETQRREALRLANLSRQELARGDATTALLLALEGAPPQLSKTDHALEPMLASALDHARAATREFLVLRGHEGSVLAASFSPDGTRMVIAGDDGAVRLWRVDGSGEPLVLTGHVGSVLAASFSPDGMRVVSAGDDGMVRLWRADGEAEPVVLTGHNGPVTAASFSPDGTRVVSAGVDGTVRLWRADVAGEPLVLEGHKGVVVDALFSPDGVRVVSAGDDGTVRLWRADGAGEPIILGEESDRIESAVLEASFSPDGTRVVSASFDGTVRLWRADGVGEPLVLMDHDGAVFDASFSPDGTRVVSAGLDGTVRLRRFDELDDPIVLKVNEGPVFAASFSPDGMQVVTAGEDGIVRLWSADGADEPLVLVGHNNHVNAALFSPDGALLMSTGADGTVRLWRAGGAGEPLVLRGHEGSVYAASFSPDGMRVVSAGRDRTVRVWRADGAGEPLILKGHEDLVRSASFSPDGTRVVSASHDGTVRLWRADGTGESLVLKGHEGRVSAASFSPDGTQIVSVGEDSTVRLWRADGTGEPLVLKGREGRVSAASFSPDGTRIVSVGEDGTVWVWRVDGRGESIVLKGHRGSVYAASFSPDGTQVVSGGGQDGTVRLWRADGGSEIVVLKRQVLRVLEGAVHAVSLSPGGARVISATADGVVRLWRADGAGEPLILRGHIGLPGAFPVVFAASFNPDGTRFLSAGADGTVRLWRYPASDRLLLDWARAAVPRDKAPGSSVAMPRQLTPEQRRQFFLADAPRASAPPP